MKKNLILLLLLPLVSLAQRFDSTYVVPQAHGSYWNSFAYCYAYENSVLSFGAPDHSVINNSEYACNIDLSDKSWSFGPIWSDYGTLFKSNQRVYLRGFNSSTDYISIFDYQSASNQPNIGFRTYNQQIPQVAYFNNQTLLYSSPELNLYLADDTLAVLDTIYSFNSQNRIRGVFLEDKSLSLYAYAGLNWNQDSIVCYYLNANGFQVDSIKKAGFTHLLPANTQFSNYSSLKFRNGKVYLGFSYAAQSGSSTDLSIVELDHDLQATGKRLDVDMFSVLGQSYATNEFVYEINSEGQIALSFSRSYYELTNHVPTYAYIQTYDADFHLTYGKMISPNPGDNGLSIDRIFADGDSLFIFTMKARHNHDHRTAYPRVIELETAEALGIDKGSIDNAPDFYPNPTQEQLYFQKAQNVRVFNMLGNLMDSYKMVESINVSHLPKGIYILEFADGSARKFIKN